MNYGVVGTGYWGRNHVRVAAELQEEGIIDTVVICDIDEKRVRSLADSYGLAYVTDHTDLVAEGIDAATVATPSTTHHDIATNLITSGIDTLVEKPLALNSDDAWNIVTTADEYNRTLGVGHIFRYHPALNELKRRINRGELGQIKYLTTDRFSFRAPRTTTGVLYSLAVHDVDIYNHIIGELPNRLYCRLDSIIKKEIDETATLVLEYEDRTGVINSSWQVPVFGKVRELVVVGSERAARIDYLKDTKIELFDAKVVSRGGTMQAEQEGSTMYDIEGEEPLKLEVKSFVEACRTKDEPRAPGRVGAQTVEILEAAEQADDKGTTVNIN